MDHPEDHPLCLILDFHGFCTWRIIPVSKWLVTPIYKPFRPFIRGITPFRGFFHQTVQNRLWHPEISGIFPDSLNVWLPQKSQWFFWFFLHGWNPWGFICLTLCCCFLVFVQFPLFFVVSSWNSQRSHPSFATWKKHDHRHRDVVQGASDRNFWILWCTNFEVHLLAFSDVVRVSLYDPYSFDTGQEARGRGKRKMW